ncbi:ATP-dependent RNA helicase CHL1 [Patellaria atrata CBS 101060]|uniref:ATP-dependent DNA helicase CHL1 n=1 Tax=Patellaria atrata CBS 101060 TaxID=1346257 RepID=A0A9P4VMZ6_9PEZI|nr:ATP-dependent RNA helicase CHL1 [Patellaria atrata CBS 101060]
MVREFYHPYNPYDVQNQFMTAVYECIKDGKVGIFESPTGTGKSLSLICSTLTWLRDHKRQTFEDGISRDLEDNNEPDWIKEHARKERKERALQQRADLEARLEMIRTKERRMTERSKNAELHPKRNKTSGPELSGLDDEQFMLDDYESDGDADVDPSPKANAKSGLSAETQALMKKLGMVVDHNDKQEKDGAIDEIKVFYCSRTHSQLTQFSNELRRVKMPPALTPNRDTTRKINSMEECSVEEFKYLTLGSRKTLCINPKVSKLGNATAINERCLEIQQPGTSEDCRCPYLPGKDSETLLNEFRDHALASVRDIEDLGELGKKLDICPYYASRPAVKSCEIVSLPYPLLLQKSARDALNLSLKDHVVVIDEAHNLMDAITGIYSITVLMSQFQRSRAQLGTYLQKFRNHLKGKNRVYLTQIVRLLDSLISYLRNKADSKPAEGVLRTGDIMTGKGLDQINLFKLTKYIQDSKLARKVDGYIVQLEEKSHETAKASSSTIAGVQNTSPRGVPLLTHIQSFLLALMNPSEEGRFFFSRTEHGNDMELKYMLLDPSHAFKFVVEEARAVILAGGTMSPMEDYTQYLFSYLPRSRLMTLSCGHVIPPANLFVSPVTQGQNGMEFNFTFEKRNIDSTIQQLGNTILQVIKVIPDGVVVFFPSYAYLDKCVTIWKRSTGSSKSFFQALSDIKPIFLESRRDVSSNSQNSKAMGVDATLGAYSAAIVSSPLPSQGALLLSVIGGSLSEGINFSDSLGRGVLVVGLPFPNRHSAEWCAKSDHIIKRAASAAEGKEAAREFYENVCMRAVNQCIGRAIRHKGDYAAIILIDRRYGADRTQRKLPGWIKGSLRKPAKLEDMTRSLDQFFKTRAG